jgi:tetratricopeptide (TPR) repeat protein
MLLLATGSHLARKRRLVILSAAGVVAVAFGVLTVKQESMWKDDLTVFTVAHQYAPHNSPVAQNLANAHVQAALALDEAGRCDEAMPIFEQVIQQYPQDWFAWAGRGECLFKLHDLASAEQSLRRASELSREPRVIEQWRELRASMGLPSAPLD